MLPFLPLLLANVGQEQHPGGATTVLYSLHATEAAKGLALALFHCIQEQNVTDFFNINGESLKLSKEKWERVTCMLLTALK